jgi:hypothetical protein
MDLDTLLEWQRLSYNVWEKVIGKKLNTIKHHDVCLADDI